VIIKKICFLSLLATLIIVLKIALQAVPFLELVTLLFIVYGITLSLKDNWLVFLVFFIVNISINGYGHYWLPYIIIFPITFTLANIIKNNNHCYLLGSLIAINCGFLIFATYFIYDWWLFGAQYAIIAGGRAFWFNFLEGLINAVAIFIIGIPLIKVINYMQKRLFYQQINLNSFNEKLTWKKLIVIGMFSLVFLASFSIIPIYLYQSNENETSYYQNKKPNLVDQKELNKNECKLIIKNEVTNKQIEQIMNCNNYPTLGKLLDDLEKPIWEINYLDSMTADYNFDGIKERFLESINNYEKNFYTTNLCPFLYVNNTLALYGVDMLSIKNENFYQIIYRKNQC